MADAQPGTPTETPETAIVAAIASGDQAAFRDARRQARQASATLTPNVTLPALESEPAKVAEPVETPEQEAESAKPDADVSEAARTLRKGRADARKQKIEGEIADLVKQRNLLRAEVQRPPIQQQTSPAPPVASTQAFPSFEQWYAANPDKSHDDYIQAAVSDGIERRFAAERAAVEQKTIFETYVERVKAFKEAHPDYDDVIEASPVHFHPEQIAEIRKSSLNTEIAYYLGTHTEEAQALAGKSPADFYKALGALEVRVSQPATPAPAPSRKLTSSAATPPTTLGSRAADSGDELTAAVASGDVARFRELRLRQRVAQQLGR